MAFSNGANAESKTLNGKTGGGEKQKKRNFMSCPSELKINSSLQASS
jgi:hypothetical protein